MEKETWKTSITQIKKGEIRVRGYDITELMEKLTFSQVVFLILKGELPNPKESKMMEAILVSSIDHGATPPSSLAARTVISGGNPLNASVAGGVLTIGDSHGGAIEQCARIFQEMVKKGGKLSRSAAELINDYSSRKKRIPGYGHRLHETDPRTVELFKLAGKLGFSGRHIDLAKEIEKKLEESSGRKLPLNVDGAIAAVISDMGFDWRMGKGFFIISRVPGLVAHAYEELTREKPMRRLGNTDFEYDGPGPKGIN
ncbi:MAG: citryl-CoA lyase [candidate division Zixibacteria bacterium]|nr:citryl-CoA lyase [candidate division Zixibacteria bacterium]